MLSGLFDLWPSYLPTSADDSHGWPLSWILPLCGCLILAFGVWARHRPHAERLQKRTSALLGVMALLAVLNYVDYGLFRYNSYVNEWDVFHYYLGTRYASELGHMNLYGAVLAADQDAGYALAPDRSARDLESVSLVPAAALLQDRDRYVSRFTSERWQEFVADLAWFRGALSQEKWQTLVLDHGYNGTPQWTFVTRSLLTGWLRITDATERALMVSVDPLLLLGMLAGVYWAFGQRPALWLILLIGTHYFLSWGHLKGCLVRTDFTVFSVLTACFLKRGRPAVAGACLAWAACSRVFPLLFALGPAAYGLGILVRERRIEMSLLRFFGSMALTYAALSILAVLVLGPEYFREWIVKIVRHTQADAIWGVGFSPLLRTDFIDGVPTLLFSSQIEGEQASMVSLGRWLVCAVVLVPSLVFASSLKPYRALLFGFVFMFFLVAPVYYYFLILALPLLFFAERERDSAGALGLGHLLLTGAAGYLFFAGHHQFYPTTFYMTCLIGLSVIGLIAMAAQEALSARE